jgi:hypothetical protein
VTERERRPRPVSAGMASWLLQEPPPRCLCACPRPSRALGSVNYAQPSCIRRVPPCIIDQIMPFMHLRRRPLLPKVSQTAISGSGARHKYWNDVRPCSWSPNLASIWGMVARLRSAGWGARTRSYAGLSLRRQPERAASDATRAHRDLPPRPTAQRPLRRRRLLS